MVCLAILLAETLLVVLLPPLMGLEPNYCDLEAGFWAAPSGTHWLLSLIHISEPTRRS